MAELYNANMYWIPDISPIHSKFLDGVLGFHPGLAVPAVALCEGWDPRSRKKPETNTKTMDNKVYYVYMLASHRNGTLYTGFTNNLVNRVFTHKNNIVKGFTQEYQVHRLVYYEVFEDREEAIKREKQLKRWYRKWKLELIEKINPNWEDLYNKII